MAINLVIWTKQINEEGTEFEGWTKIGPNKFAFKLKASRRPYGGKNYKLTLKKDNEEIPLSKDEYEFFYKIFFSYISDRFNNGIIESPAISRNGILSDFGLVDFHPEAIATLNEPKFGCRITY